MVEIKIDQELEVNNILSFRGKIKQSELENVGKDMEMKLNKEGAKRIGNPITATYGMYGEYLDVEILLPIDRSIDSIGEYCFKEKIRIVNAIVASYKGSPTGLQNACDELNKYIMQKQLQPITVGYNVTRHVDPMNIENTEIDVWVGISPNIL